MSKNHRRLVLLCSTVVVVAQLCLPQSLLAEDLDDEVAFNIEPQALDTALLEFSNQADIQVMAAADLVDGIDTQGVEGLRTAESALGALLEDTGLHFATIGSTVTVVEREKDSGKAQPVSSPIQIAETQAPAKDPASNPDPLTSQDRNDDGQILRIEEIVVTGSRLRRTGLDSPIPVTSVTADDIELSGSTSIGDILIEQPSIGIGANRNTNLGIRPGLALGANLVNLRRLGTNRTLVVVDGRRHIGSVAGATAVDVNSIPTALVDRMEISTGGASVSYGADAVSGVVNIIMKDKFEGLRIDTRYGVSDRDDADQVTLSLTGGLNFADDRGNATLSVSYDDSKDALGKDRDWVRTARALQPNPDNTGPNDGILDQVIGPPGGRLPISSLNPSYFGLVPFAGAANAVVDDGTVRPYDGGESAGGFLVIGGDGLAFEDVIIKTVLNPVERLSIDGRIHFDVNDNTRLFAEAKYYNVEAESTGQVMGDIFAVPSGAPFFIAPDNPFAPFGDPVFDQFYADNFGAVVFSRFNPGLSRDGFVDRETERIVGGIQGEIGSSDLHYEAYYQYGESTEARRDIARDINRWALGVDVTTDVAGILGPAGAPVCRARLAAGGVPTGNADVDDCVPVNVFDPVNSVGQAASDYVLMDLRSPSILRQNVAGLSLAGDVFDVPGGAVSFAAGLEYRKEKSASHPDPRWAITQDGFSPAVVGTYETTEAFLEARFPLLTDVRFAKVLAVEAGVRQSHYTTVGDTTAWRANLEWAPTEDVRFRGGFAQAVRAPNVSELFTPQSGGFSLIIDPCDSRNVNLGPNPERRLTNCQALLAPLGLDSLTFQDPQVGTTKTTINGGNPDLEEEGADSITIGAVFTPRFVPGLAATVDYFDIEITDAISTPSTQGIVNDCVDRFDTIDNEFCALFTRVDSGLFLGTVADVVATQRNIAALETQGVDFEISYGFELAQLGLGGNSGSLDLRMGGTYLDKFRFLPSNNAATFDESAGELGSPHWRFNLQPVYRNGPFTFSWQMRYIGKSEFDVQAELPVADAEAIHDLQLRYRFGQVDSGARAELYLGVNDLFDLDPPHLTRLGAGAGSRSLYDTIGRFFYGGVTVRL